MPAGPLEITVPASWAHALRGAVYEALFTHHRVTWLLRIAFAALLVAAGQSAIGAICVAVPCPDRGPLELVLLILPLVWLISPLARLPAAVARTVTIRVEGLTTEAASHSLSVARECVRSVRRTPWDLVFVLDGAAISVPLSTLPAGTTDAVLARLRPGTPAPSRAGEGEGGAPRGRAPYRSPGSRPLGPEDEEAEPGDWVAPSTYRESVLAFPTARDHVCALVSTKRGSLFTPAVLLVLAVCLVLLGNAGGGDAPGEIVPFTGVGALVALMGLGVLVLEISPALLAMRERSLRERSAGVLYAVGKSGLYMRTHSFERRDSWERVQVVKIGARRVAISVAGLVHVIPMAAFRHDGARTTFVSTLERETARRGVESPGAGS